MEYTKRVSDPNAAADIIVLTVSEHAEMYILEGCQRN